MGYNRALGHLGTKTRDGDSVASEMGPGFGLEISPQVLLGCSVDLAVIPSKL